MEPNQLPDSFVSVGGVYNEEIRLLGYGYYDSNFQAGGYLSFELYWQPLRRPEKDYTVTFRLVHAGTQQIEDIQNARLAIHSPTLYSSDWQQGTVYIDRYLIILPTRRESEAINVYIGLYNTEIQQLLPITSATAEVQDNHIRLTGVSINDDASLSQVNSISAQAVWGDALALRSATCSFNEGLNVRLDWETWQRPERPWHLFVHVLGENGTLLDQQDGVIVPDAPLDTWLPGRTVSSVWTFEGIVDFTNIQLGFYDVFTGQRWSVTQGGNSAENLYQLSCDV